MSFTGTEEQTPVQNGTYTQIFRGRNGVAFGPFAPYPNTFFFLIGTFATVHDANTGHTIQGPTGHGQMINMCTLLE